MFKAIFSGMLIAYVTCVQAQNSVVNWNRSFHQQNGFVENLGQFDHFDKGSSIHYVLDEGNMVILFTDKGPTYRFSEKQKNSARKRGDRNEAKYFERKEYVQVEWVGVAPNASLSAHAKRSDSNTYTTLNADRSLNTFSNVSGYERVLYENVYAGIDVEYTVHPEDGIKYNLTVHPGADPSKALMQFGDHRVSILPNGNAVIATSFGDIVDHAPRTYYADAPETVIECRFVLNGNALGFELGEYDDTRTIIIDPWVQTPAFPNSQGIWDVDVDDLGNVYIYGGDTPMRLRKFDAAGGLLWTYNTPWDSANYWIGTMITEPTTGDCFITAGTDPRIQRISTSGTMLWNASGGAFDEYWKFSFNCDFTRLMLGGTRLVIGPQVTPIGYGAVFEINMNNGAQVNLAPVAGVTPGPLGLIANPNEIRAMCPSPNGKYYYMTLDTIGVFDDNLTLGYQNNHTYNFSYAVAGYGVTNQSINAMAATTDHIYTQNGSSLDKRNIVDGSIIASVTIPGGQTSVELGFSSAENSGLVLDSCGNVYVGSGNGVYKFDADLNFIASQTTPGRVYDVAVNPQGEVVACGQGFVASVSLSPCKPPKAICLNCLEVMPAGPYCQTDGVDTLEATPSSGVWSGTGIVDSVLGIFDPSLAGPGEHVIHFSPEVPLQCGIDSIVITVNFCEDLIVCFDEQGDITLLNGTGPFVWSQLIDTVDCSACIAFPGFPPCSFPPGCSVQSTGGFEFGSGTSVTPTGNWPIQVEDSQGNILEIASMSEVSPCSEGCFIQVSVPTEVNVCIDGAAAVTANVIGAIGNISYSWNTLPVQTTQIAVGLQPGAYYTVTVTDDSLCTAVDSVLVNEIACVGPIVCATPFGDLQADGVGPFTWFEYSETEDCSGCVPFPGLPPCSFPPGCAVIVNEWVQFATGEEVTPPGTFPILVIDGSGDSLVINSLSELPLCTQECYIQVELPEVSYLCFGQSNGTVTAVVSGALGTVNYAWSTVPAQNNATANLPEGEFTIIATDQYNCADTATVEVLTLPEILLEFSSTEQVCVGTNSGLASVLATQGVGAYQYSWNTTPPQSMAAISGLAAGNYTVEVTDQANCTATGSVTIGSFPETNVSAGEDVTICEGEQVQLTATGADSYVWSTGETSVAVVVSPESTGNYSVVGTDVNGCEDSDTVAVEVQAIPEVQIGEVDSFYCTVFPAFQLTALPQGGVFSGNGVTSGGMFDPGLAGHGVHEIVYSFSAIANCYGRDTVDILVDAFACDVTVPSVFNPETDFEGGVDFCGNPPQNNVFALPCLEWYPGNRVLIFDRWGRKVYDQTDYHLKPWDGGKHSDGVYYYVVELPNEESKKGFFHLLR